jgi:hypothetical protein
MFNKLKAPVASRHLTIMPRSVRATWLNDIMGTNRNTNAATVETSIHSLPQLLDYLATSTSRLIDLMKLKGAGILIRNNKIEILHLKAAIHQRKLFPLS